MAVSDSYVQVVDQPNVNLETENLLESLPPETKERIAVLRRRREPVNILVIGPTGAGKSALINALMGNTVARVAHGPGHVTSKLEKYEGTFEGVKIRVYDTVGFSDTDGKSDTATVSDIDKASNFDLVLICLKLDSRADAGVKRMFNVLAIGMTKEMWMRSVVVLTFANHFLELDTVQESNESEADILRSETARFKAHICKFLSHCADGKIISEIPFCLAGSKRKKKLPTTNNWLRDLLDTCIMRCSDDVRPFLKKLAKHRLLLEIGAIAGTSSIGAGIGAGIGASIGSAVPIAGSIIGAGVGAGIGASVGFAVSGGGVATGRIVTEIRERIN